MAWQAKGKVTRRERFLAEMDAVIPRASIARRKRPRRRAGFGSFLSEAPPPMLDYHCRVRFYGHGSAIVLQAPKDAEAQFLLPAEP
jgi:hypothetical protein